jgi:CheY-like chemotaxis protein
MPREGDESEGSKPILIVDAYGHSREGLSASLRAGGWIVDTAAGSWEAVQKATEGGFGLAIIDVDLPPAQGVAVSGWDVARIFRAFHPDAGVILVSAESRPEMTTASPPLDRVRVVEKPVSPAALRTLLRALESERTEPAKPSTHS